MLLIKKLVNYYKNNSEADYNSTFVINAYISLNVKINKLKDILKKLSNTRNKKDVEERKELIKHLFRLLEYIGDSYSYYLLDLADLKNFLKAKSNIKLKNNIKQQVAEAIISKSKIQKEFETIYHNFKNTAKKIPGIPMREILTKMRSSFYFNNAKLKLEQKLKAFLTYPSW